MPRIAHARSEGTIPACLTASVCCAATGPPFRTLLPPRSRPRGPGADRQEEAGESAPAVVPAWLRPEGPPAGTTAARHVPPVASASGDRLLVGAGPAGSEARLQIAHGPLAGTEIHLRVGPSGIEATVLTTAESARQTLCMAMQEVARRLRHRGHALRATVDTRWSGRERR